MAEPRRATALDQHERVLAAIGAHPVVLASQVSVRVDGRTAGAVGLPMDPNTWSRLDGRDALWLGPDEWLITSEAEPAGDVIADLDSRIGADHHRSLVDVSANRVVIETNGARRIELLRSGCGLDLDRRSWRGGMCAQTLLANVAVLLQERDESTRVFARPSFAGHLVTWFGIVGPTSR